MRPRAALLSPPYHLRPQLFDFERHIDQSSIEHVFVAGQGLQLLLVLVMQQLVRRGLSLEDLAEQSVQLVPVDSVCVQQTARYVFVLRVPHGVAEGELSVASCASDLLYVRLEALGQVGVDDAADVALVEAHAERARRNHDRQLVAHEARLHRVTLRQRQSGVVVGARREAVLLQVARQCLRALLVRHINDERVQAFEWRGREQRHQRLEAGLVAGLRRRQDKIAAPQRRAHDVPPRDAQVRAHLTRRRRRRRRRQAQNSLHAEYLVQHEVETRV